MTKTFSLEDIDRLLYWWVWEDQKRAALPVWYVAHWHMGIPYSRTDFHVIDQGYTLDQAKSRCEALSRHNPGRYYAPTLMPSAPRQMF